MRIMLSMLLLLIFQNIATAGEMKKIDQVTRETVAYQYYNGIDDEGFLNFMQFEVMNLNLEEDQTGKCLVQVTGMATNYYDPELNMYKFWVCITRNEDGVYFGSFIKDELVEI